MNRSGLIFRGRAAADLAEAIVSYDKREREWFDRLFAFGITAQHPDDGWHDWTKRWIYFAYPGFAAKEPVIGDLVAIGCVDDYFLVQLTGWADHHTMLDSGRYWAYKPYTQEALPGDYTWRMARRDVRRRDALCGVLMCLAIVAVFIYVIYKYGS